MRVRGFRASISASRMRLNAMAAERAPTMAITIQSSLPPNSRGVEWLSPESQQCSGERERQRKHRVLELDHLERQPQPLPKSHFRYHLNSCVPFVMLSWWPCLLVGLRRKYIHARSISCAE